MQEQNSNPEYPPIILNTQKERKKAISECIVKLENGQRCNKPIGQDSKIHDVPYCTDHRVCNLCNKTITPREAEHCILNQMDSLKCARCLVTETANARLAHSTGESVNITITQKHLDELNNARLMVTADLNLSDEGNEYDAKIKVQHFFRDMDFDQMRASMKKMQAVAAEASLLIQKDRRFTSAKYKEEKLKDQKEKASLVSAHEDRITAFMVERNILDRDFARKQYAKYESQQAKRTASHFERAKHAKKPVSQTESVSVNQQAIQQIALPDMTPEEKKRHKAIIGLMKSNKYTYEFAAEVLDSMFTAKQQKDSSS